MFPEIAVARILTIILMGFMLSSCGYHLRGHSTISAQFTQLVVTSSDGNSEFRNKVVRALKESGSTIVHEKSRANTVLKLGPVEDTKRLISINSLAQGRDYSLFKRIRFSLLESDGKVIIDNRSVEVRRDFVKTPVDALSNDQQEIELSLELEQALIQGLLLQMTFN